MGTITHSSKGGQEFQGNNAGGRWVTIRGRRVYIKGPGEVPVRFDPKDGIGAVPNNQSIDYFGFQKKLTPDQFLQLAKPQMMEPTAPGIEKAIRKGKAVGPPFFSVEWREKVGAWRITSHEGRNRSIAIRNINPKTLMPVHFFPSGGLRARDLTPEMLQASIISEDGSSSMLL